MKLNAYSVAGVCLISIFCIGSEASALIRANRGQACAETEAAARAELQRAVETSGKFCSEGIVPEQNGGWQCKKIKATAECGSIQWQCVTQFICAGDNSGRKVAQISAQYPATSTNQVVQTTSESVDSVGNHKSITKFESGGEAGHISGTIEFNLSKEKHAELSAFSKDLRGALAECSPFQGSIQHPLMQTEKIHYQVHGKTGGFCKLTQTMPGDLTTCQISDSMREQLKSQGESAFQSLMADQNVCKHSGE